MRVFGGFLLLLVAKKTPKDALGVFCLSFAISCYLS